MQETKEMLIALRDSLSEDTFDMDDFLIEIDEINEDIDEVDIYIPFAYILEVNEIPDYNFEQEIVDFVNSINNYTYVDIKKLEALNFDDIIHRLDNLIAEL